jgi:thioesterase domain-containing protein/acyl carrier protein
MRTFLKMRLPEFMIPGTFVRMDSLPLNPNGKVDRGALPDPEAVSPREKGPPERPFDETEKHLADIWMSLLGRSPTGVRDNFFEVGGHSLLAVRLVYAAEKRFGTRLSVADIFRYPTLGEMAAAIRRQTGAAGSAVLVPLQPSGSLVPFFWIHGDHSNIPIARPFDPNQPVYALVPQSDDVQPACYTDVRSIALHYLQLVRTVQPHGPYSLGGYSLGGLIAYEMAQCLQNMEENVALLVVLEPATPQPEIPDPPEKPSRNITAGFKRRPGTFTGFDIIRRLRSMARGVIHTVAGIKTRFERQQKRSRVKPNRAVNGSEPRGPQSTYLRDLYSEATREHSLERFDGPVLLVTGATEGPSLEARWQELVRGKVEILRVPGGHMDLTEERSMTIIAGRIGSRLHELQGKKSAPVS